MLDPLEFQVGPRTGPDVEFFQWLRTEDGGSCTLAGQIDGGMYCAIKPLLFHWTMIIGVIGDRTGYEDRYCYGSQALASAALLEWATREYRDEPKMWHRHPKSGRRREGGDAEQETVAP